MKGLYIGDANLAMKVNCEATREFCFTPNHVTFASTHKVKFYRDFDFGRFNKVTLFLDKEAQATISKLKTSLLFRKGIIENVTADINKTEHIIYFDVTLAFGVTQNSVIELLEYLDTCF